jgi:hypothetical protein
MKFWNIIGAAWRGAFLAARYNLQLFITVIAVQLIFGIALSYVSPALPTPDNPGFSSSYKFYVIISTIAAALFAVLPMIAVHRYILRGEVGQATQNNGRIIHFAFALVLVRLAAQISTLLHSIAPALSVAATILIFVVYFLLVRFILVFPLTALDAPHPWSESWAMTRRHWWFSFGVMLCGFLPLLLISAIWLIPCFHLILQIQRYGGEHAFAIAPWFVVFEDVCGSLEGIIFVSVGAALASGLYRKYSAFPV